MGGLAVGILSLGGVAIGILTAVGGVAIGYSAVGGLAIGVQHFEDARIYICDLLTFLSIVGIYLHPYDENKFYTFDPSETQNLFEFSPLLSSFQVPLRFSCVSNSLQSLLFLPD